MYIDELLLKYGMSNCNATVTAMASDADIKPANQSDEALSTSDQNLYRRQIGELVYLAACTRLEISFAVCTLARSLLAPTVRHMTTIRRVPRYLSATRSQELRFKRDNDIDFNITAYSDLD